jgi:hypothetical protein
MQETHIPDISQQQEPAISVLPWKTLKHEKRMETKIIENKKKGTLYFRENSPCEIE